MNNNSSEQETFVEEFLKKMLGEQKQFQEAMSDLHKKSVLLSRHYMKKKKKQKRFNNPNPTITLTNIKYEDYETMHDMWNQYMTELLANSGSNNTNQMQSLLLKADFHGAAMTVVRSRCLTMRNQSGIVVTESKNFFQIVTKKDKMIMVPKKSSIFEITFLNNKITIFGDQFCYKPGHRLVKKFGKYLSTLPLV